jgi:hypothetical protein
MATPVNDNKPTDLMNSFLFTSKFLLKLSFRALKKAGFAFFTISFLGAEGAGV